MRTVLEVLLVMFVTLKLVGVINWSWWLVLAPFLAPYSILILCYIALGVIAFKENKK